MSEFWGYCSTCQQSFFLGPARSASPLRARCPVCLAPPVQVLQRRAGSRRVTLI